MAFLEQFLKTIFVPVETGINLCSSLT